MPLPRNPLVDPVSASVKMVRPPMKKLPWSLMIKESAMATPAAAKMSAEMIASEIDRRVGFVN
jgi:hypothetical protein